jgi:hypothetical protein
MEQTATYKYSDDSIRRAKRQMLTLLVAMPILLAILVVGFTFLSPLYKGGDFASTATIMIIPIIAVEITLYLTLVLSLKRVRRRYISLFGAALKWLMVSIAKNIFSMIYKK